jgi:hypothetical protein
MIIAFSNDDIKITNLLIHNRATSGDQTLLLYYVSSVLSFKPTDILAIMFLLLVVCMSAVFTCTGGTTKAAQSLYRRTIGCHCLFHRSNHI